jgi:hypothetical protein
MKYQEKLVDKFDITDIDLEYNYSEEVDENGDQIRIDIVHSDDVYYSECPPAKIDEVIEQLIELKNKGAERVYISEHVDHHGYYFYGVKLEEYIPTKVVGWRCLKTFPGSNEGEMYIFNSNSGKYYLHPQKHEQIQFKDFEKYPEFFEQIEIEI